MVAQLSSAPTGRPALERSSDAVWLGRLCWMLICASLAAWTSFRVKPVLWFGVIFGVLFGALAAVVQFWVPVPRTSRSIAEITVLAMLGTAVSLWVGGERLRAAAASKVGNDAVAEMLIKALQQMPSDPHAPPPVLDSPVGGVQPTFRGRCLLLLDERYQRWPVFPVWTWFAAELLLAGLAAGGLRCWTSARRPASDEQQEAAQ